MFILIICVNKSPIKLTNIVSFNIVSFTCIRFNPVRNGSKVSTQVQKPSFLVMLNKLKSFLTLWFSL